MKKPQLIDVNESLRLTAELARNQTGASEVSLDLKLSSRSPQVLAHPAELSEVLFSLVSNAVDAISSQGVSGKVQITSAVIRNRVVVSVTGDGHRPLAPAAPFKAKLNASRQIVREIGGDVWISSEQSYGPTFMMDLPSAFVN